MNRKIMFVHIPKTGGYTLDMFFRSCCGYERSVDVTYEAAVPHDVFDEHDVILGHRPITFFEDYPVAHPKFTIFREPAERLVSYQRYLSRRHQHPLHSWARSVDFPTFCAEAPQKDRTARSQAYYATGNIKPTLNEIREAIDKRFWMASTLEYIDVAADIVRKYMGWPPAEIGHFNDGGGSFVDSSKQSVFDDISIDSATLKAVRRDFALDYYAYSYALERFVERWVLSDH